MTPLGTAVAAHEHELVALRRHLHAQPEPSGEEHLTTELIVERLAVEGLHPLVLGLGTGVVCDISLDPDVPADAATGAGTLVLKGSTGTTVTIPVTVGWPMRPACAFMAGAGLMQHSGPLAVQLCGAALEDLEEQGVLGAEMIVHRGQIDPGLRGDVSDRDALEPVKRKEPLGSRKDGGLGCGFIGVFSGRHRVGHGANPSVETIA